MKQAQNISAQAINALSKSSSVGLVKEARQLVRCCLPAPIFPKQTFNEDGFILIDSYRENEEDGFIVLNSTDANGSDDGDFLAVSQLPSQSPLNLSDICRAHNSLRCSLTKPR